MNRIIFLDIDGVLNSAKWMVSQSFDEKVYTSMFERHINDLDPAAVKMISDLAVETQSGIIVSSSWRILHPLHEIRDMLKACGMDERVLPHGVTPRSRKSFRGDEVNEWLEQNPDVCIHVIFDDDNDFHPNQPLINTSWEVGVQPEHIERARKILMNTK